MKITADFEQSDLVSFRKSVTDFLNFSNLSDIDEDTEKKRRMCRHCMRLRFVMIIRSYCHTYEFLFFFVVFARYAVRNAANMIFGTSVRRFPTDVVVYRIGVEFHQKLI